MSHNLAHSLGQSTNDIAYQLRIEMTTSQHTKEIIGMLDTLPVGTKACQIGTKAQAAATDFSADACLETTAKGVALFGYTLSFYIILIAELSDKSIYTRQHMGMLVAINMSYI